MSNMNSLSAVGLVKEAKKRGFKIEIVDEGNALYYLVRNGKRILCKLADVGLNSYLGGVVANHKNFLSSLLEYHKLPHPKTILLKKSDSLDFDEFRKNIEGPFIVKPFDGAHGKGISTFLNTKEDFDQALEIAFKFSDAALIQDFIEGDDHRLLVMDGKFRAAVKRTACFVRGDGQKNISELIDQENKNPLRGGSAHDKLLVQIVVDDLTKSYLKRRYGYDLQTVPFEGEQVFIKPMANVSSGGFIEDITPFVCDEMKELAEKVAKISGLKVVGIDFLTKDCSQPLEKMNGTILELNKNPALYVHDGDLLGIPGFGSYGVFEKLLDMIEADIL